MILENTGFYKSIYHGGEPVIMEIDFVLNTESDSVRFGLGASKTGIDYVEIGSSYVRNRDSLILGSYSYGQPISLAVRDNEAFYDIYINGAPVCFGQDKNQVGFSSYFHISGAGSVDILNYSVYSATPSYRVTDSITTNSTEGALTGWIYNDSSYPFEYYDATTNSDLMSVSAQSGVIAPSGSGAFIIDRGSEYTGGLLNVPLYFSTNFGDFLFPSLVISGNYFQGDIREVNLYGDSRAVDGFATNYIGSIYSESETTDYTVSLSGVSYYGWIYKPTTFSGYHTATFSGYITGEGSLHSTSNVLCSGVSATGTTTATLLCSGDLFAYATGAFTKSYSFSVSGIATGIGYTGLATGVATYSLSGVINDGSGYYDYNTSFTSISPTSLHASQDINLSAATGAIYYNIPESGDCSDILYVGNKFVGIVYGFHYNSISGLASYLNSNQSIHEVSATVSGSNTILLSNVEGYEGNFVLLDVDNDNNGNMNVSSSSLLGGADTLFTGALTAVGSFSGIASGRYTHTGYYAQTSNQIFYAQHEAAYQNRAFRDIWNVKTGANYASMVDFNAANLYESVGSGLYTSSGNQNGIFYIDLFYNRGSFDSDDLDVAELSISSGSKTVRKLISGLV